MGEVESERWKKEGEEEESEGGVQFYETLEIGLTRQSSTIKMQ